LQWVGGGVSLCDGPVTGAGERRQRRRSGAAPPPADAWLVGRSSSEAANITKPRVAAKIPRMSRFATVRKGDDDMPSVEGFVLSRLDVSLRAVEASGRSVRRISGVFWITP